jgi:hypothetical protein
MMEVNLFATLLLPSLSASTVTREATHVKVHTWHSSTHASEKVCKQVMWVHIMAEWMASAAASPTGKAFVTNLVVLLALAFVRQYVVSSRDLFEFFGITSFVRMVLNGQFFISSLDLFRG